MAAKKKSKKRGRKPKQEIVEEIEEEETDIDDDDDDDDDEEEEDDDDESDDFSISKIKKAKSDKVPVGIQFPGALHRQLRSVAKEAGVSLSALIRQMVTHCLKRLR